MRNLALKAYTWRQARPGVELLKAYKKEEGQTAIEYAVVVAAVSLALVILLITFGTSVINKAKSKVDAFAF